MLLWQGVYSGENLSISFILYKSVRLRTVELIVCLVNRIRYEMAVVFYTVFLARRQHSLLLPTHSVQLSGALGAILGMNRTMTTWVTAQHLASCRQSPMYVTSLVNNITYLKQ